MEKKLSNLLETGFFEFFSDNNIDYADFVRTNQNYLSGNLEEPATYIRCIISLIHDDNSLITYFDYNKKEQKQLLNLINDTDKWDSVIEMLLTKEYSNEIPADVVNTTVMHLEGVDSIEEIDDDSEPIIFSGGHLKIEVEAETNDCTIDYWVIGNDTDDEADGQLTGRLVKNADGESYSFEMGDDSYHSDEDLDFYNNNWEAINTEVLFLGNDDVEEGIDFDDPDYGDNGDNEEEEITTELIENEVQALCNNNPQELLDAFENNEEYSELEVFIRETAVEKIQNSYDVDLYENHNEELDEAVIELLKWVGEDDDKEVSADDVEDSVNEIESYFDENNVELTSSFSLIFMAQEIAPGGATKDNCEKLSVLLCNLENTEVMTEIANGNYENFDIHDSSLFNDDYEDMMSDLFPSEDEDDDDDDTSIDYDDGQFYDK